MNETTENAHALGVNPEERNPHVPLSGLQTGVRAVTEISAEKSQKARNESPTRPSYTAPWHMSKRPNALLHRVSRYCRSSHSD